MDFKYSTGSQLLTHLPSCRKFATARAAAAARRRGEATADGRADPGFASESGRPTGSGLAKRKLRLVLCMRHFVSVLHVLVEYSGSVVCLELPRTKTTTASASRSHSLRSRGLKLPPLLVNLILSTLRHRFNVLLDAKLLLSVPCIIFSLSNPSRMWRAFVHYQT